MKRDLIWLTVASVCAFAVLCGLGAWQLQRLAWKEDLIARIEARTRAEPVSLEQAIDHWRRNGEVEYLRVTFDGKFRHGAERHLFTVIKGESGWKIITPVETGTGDIVLVDRGFVPDALKSPGKREQGQLEETISMTGLARAPGTQGLFTPDNNPEKNAWYWRDLESMASALDPTERSRLVPFFIELEASDIPGGYPRGGVTRVNLPNKHLQYAITWFGLALVLLAVFAIYLRGRIAQARSPKTR